MDRNRILPALVCGFGAAVLDTVPGIKSLGWCLIVPLAAIFAIFLDHKINKTIFPVDIKTAVFFGIMTGMFATVFSTFFEVLITFITKTNDFVETLPQFEIFIRQFKFGSLFDQTMPILNQMVTEIKTTGFSLMYTMAIFIGALIINTIFGLLGGILGMAYLNKKAKS